MSRNVARFSFSQPSVRPEPHLTTIVFADGRGFADALTAGAALSLAEGKSAVVLVNGSTSAGDTDTAAFVLEADPSRLFIAGGVESIPQEFEDSLAGVRPGATRGGGADRYEVSATIAFYFDDPAIATGPAPGASRHPDRSVRIRYGGGDARFEEERPWTSSEFCRSCASR